MRAIFINEIRGRWRGVLIWVLSWSAMAAMLMLFFDTLAANKDELEAVFSAMPPEFFAAFSTDIKTLGTIEGYVNSQLLSLLLIGAPIWVGWLSAQLIAAINSTPEFFKYLSLNYYFNVEKLSTGGSLGVEFLVLPAACPVLLVLGYLAFKDKDFS